MKDPADQATIDAFDAPRKSRGGKRIGAGMKQKYGEPTTTLRVPESRREALELWLAVLERVGQVRRDGNTEAAEGLEQALNAAERAFFDELAVLSNKPKN